MLKFPSPLNATAIKPKTPQSFVKGGPQVSNTVIKCGHCNSLFKSAKDLAGHKCVKSVKQEPIDESKQLELIAQAAAAASAPTKPAAKTARSRARTPKKTAQTQQQPVIDLNALTAAQGIANQSEDGTQVIMILNQESGELMEITAPQGMAVSEVINSLNFVRPNISEVATIPANGSNTVAFDPQELHVQQSEDSAALSTIVGQQLQSGDGGSGGEQTIMLPANCFNEDGSLTLDAATLSSLNLAIAVDGNGELTTDGNTTFIIDTSNSR
jgi:hypothetical protein